MATDLDAPASVSTPTPPQARATAPETVARAVGRVVWQVLAWSVVLAALAVLMLAVVVPRLAGATPYTVLTGSMQPTYPPGTLVVTRPVAADDLAVGDAITFQRDSGRSTVVTHRVVAVARGTVDGELALTTQGDANPTPDPDPVQPVQVRGRVWYAVPYLGHLNSALSGQQRQWATYGVGAGLCVYALVMAGGALLDRRRRGGSP